ncbi:MAG TPA: hypothetical protein PLS90_08615 [Candidatus Sumerlaeota bacterium]|nr:MAG: hypothetical protein BWZ08_02009 [candidate division BRC1 bacterium ADurb.BinA292]HPK02507.1 hypothetical protein [Candidatus Sumerlaeota bacterium]
MAKANKPANAPRKSAYELWALLFCFGGAALALLIALGAHAAGGRVGLAFWVFVVTQVAAIGLGLLTWRSPQGRAAAITATVLILLTLMALR